MLLRPAPSTRSIPWASLIALLLVSLQPSVEAVDDRVSYRETPIVRAVKRTRPSVVSINGRKTVRDDSAPIGSSDRSKKVNGMGTGVIIDERGYIITNYHVVQGVAKIRVTMYDQTLTSARLVAHDPRTDLAVIKIDSNKRLPVIPCGTSSDLMLGETVIAIGNAYGYKDTITRGVISELSRTVEVSDDQTYYNLIQTDAAINPGNSGGPLINIDGEMIGINCAVRMGAQGIGFAIPVNPALEIVAELIRKENRNQTTLAASAATNFKLDRPRLMISKSNPQLDLFQGDQIETIDGRRVTKRLDLERCLIGRKAGDWVTLSIRRGTETKTIKSQLVAGAAVGNPIEKQVWNAIGVKLAEIPKHQFRRYSKKYGGGLRVVAVRNGSQAMEQNIQAGDVLIGIHEWETTSMGHIAYIIEQDTVFKSNNVEFFVIRNGEVLKGNLRLASRTQ